MNEPVLRLAGSPGPHVFVSDLGQPDLSLEDAHHLRKSLRLRTGAALTACDGEGTWATATLLDSDGLELTMEPHHVPAPTSPTTVALSLVKGQKPELAVQKLTELGIDNIVLLDADRSVVRWDDMKIDAHRVRLQRIVHEASMQSHRVRRPTIELLTGSHEWLSQDSVAIAHFGGRAIAADVRSIAIGPEGGWSNEELSIVGTRTVTLGATVLRAETAAIAAGTLLSAS